MAATAAILLTPILILSIASHLVVTPPIDQTASRLVLDRDGELLRAFPVADGRWRLPVDLHQVDPILIDFLLMWEDRRFYSHHGVDWTAMTRALVQLLKNRRIVSGGSTLTMQLVRLLGDQPTRSVSGKWQQILAALALERHASKTDILRAYLQRAGYGGNLEGVRSASLAYFGKEPRRLTPAEAALLVALPQSPELRRPDRHPQAAAAARRRILDRAAATGIIDADTARHAHSTPVPRTRQDLPSLATHRAEFWIRRMPDQPVVSLTIRASVQRELERLATQRAEALPPRASTAILALDHATGEIIASVGSAGYTDLSRNGFIDMTEAVRSPGSALKPLIYGVAFELGMAHPETLVEDRPSGFGNYAPSNFDGDFAGTVTIREALQRSLNVPAVLVLEQIGPARLLARLRRAGVKPVLPGERPAGLAIALGGIGVRLRDLVAVYGAIARGGTPVQIRELLSPTKDAPAPGLRSPTPVLDRRSAWYLSAILSGADAWGTGANAIAVKTGTSFGYRDAWALGFDGRHVVGVWVGRPDGAPVSGLTGATTAVPILTDVFARLGPTTPFPPAPAGTLQVSNSKLPAPLRRLGFSAAANRPTGPVQIAYPPDGARIDLGSDGPSGSNADLALKARGGQAPFTWIVNGRPLGRDPFASTSQWQPDGTGFTDILLIDATGSTSTARVFIE